MFANDGLASEVILLVYSEALFVQCGEETPAIAFLFCEKLWQVRGNPRPHEEI